MVKIDDNWGLVVGKLVSIADNGTQIVGTTKKCVTNSVVGCYAFCAFYTLLMIYTFHVSYTYVKFIFHLYNQSISILFKVFYVIKSILQFIVIEILHDILRYIQIY